MPHGYKNTLPQKTPEVLTNHPLEENTMGTVLKLRTTQQQTLDDIAEELPDQCTILYAQKAKWSFATCGEDMRAFTIVGALEWAKTLVLAEGEE